ncbi:MAG: DUF4270 domain-containing protein [Mediterranea sp.]|jgi:hypothetical protein|nr:DUF4270 domain-containing protein [Mediterranea sp.]
MKAKYLWLVLITPAFFGCEDNTGELGLGMLPKSDEITVIKKTFSVITGDSLSGAVFAKTNVGYVGRFTDHEYGFGSYEGGFLTELNCVDDLTFPKAYDAVTNRDPSNNMIGTVDESFELARIVLSYYNFFGDSLNPMRVSIYELDKKNLEKTHYTNTDPDDYTTKTKLLGRKTFSAVDLADSLRHQTNYLYQVSIPIDDELGLRIMKENQANPDAFKNSETFGKFFKGLYITSDIGEGTVLYIQHVQLDVVFKSFQLDSVGDILKKTTGEDSTYLAYRSFASTMEVVQSNRILISDEIKEKVKEENHTYLKSPAGIYTRAILPVGEIVNGIDFNKDTINSVKLVFNAYHHDTESEYSISPPATVLLIREKEVKDFFNGNMIPNNTTSYYANYASNSYSFTNIMRLATTLAKELEEAKKTSGAAWNEEKEKEWLNENALAVIPITLGTQTSSSGSTTITNVRHDLKPAYVKLKGGNPEKGGSALELQVIYSRFHE